MTIGGEAGHGGRARTSRIAMIGFGISLLAALILLVAAVGYRLDLWSTLFALLTLSGTAFRIAALGAVVSLVGLGASLPRGYRGMALSIVGVLVGGYFAFQGMQFGVTVKSVPFIHDITTDTVNPPQFVAVVPAREAEGANPHEYAGPELAAKQNYGYPNLTGYVTEASVSDAFEAAHQTAIGMGWQIVDVVPAEGRIEATEVSFWYGFKDDVVIRVSSDGEGAETRVDVRSLSRTGASDLGVNAARISAFITALDSVL